MNQKLKTNQKTKPAFSHDSFFKHFYSDPKLTKELFGLVFSKQTLKTCNWNKMKIEKDTFKGKRADLIFSVPLTSHPKVRLNIFILLEHKAHYDKELHSQCLGYQVLMREHHLVQFGCAMPTSCVLFYHGKQPLKWNKTLQEEDFGKNLSKIPVEFRKNMLNYGIKILDANSPQVRKAYKKLKSRGVIDLLSKIWSIKKPGPAKVKDIFLSFEALLKQTKGQQKKDTILKILEYLIDNTGLDLKTWKKAERLIIEEGILPKGGVMDIREHIKEKGRYEGMQKGIQKGRQEGRQEGMQARGKEIVLNMLKKSADLSFISEVTGLSEKEIKKLKNGQSK